MRRFLALVALSILCACQPEPEPTGRFVPPEGYLAVQAMKVLPLGKDAAFFERRADATDPLLGAGALVIERDDVGAAVALLVAETHGWRVLRYPLLSLDPLRVGAPSEIATATYGHPGVPWIATSLPPGDAEARFGRHMARTPGGDLVVSGLEGDLWHVSPQVGAVRLGAGAGGRAMADGVALGAASVRDVQALTVDPGGPRRPGGLLMAVADRIFWAPLEALQDPSLPLVHVAGSGLRVARAQEGVATRAGLGIGAQAALKVDSAGNLFVLAPQVGQVLLVRDYLSPQAQVRALAGGGTSLPLADPLETALSLNHPLLEVVEEGASRVVFFGNMTGLASVRLENVAAKATDLTGINFSLRAPGGMVRLEEQFLLTRGLTGTLEAFAVTGERTGVLIGEKVETEREAILARATNDQERDILERTLVSQLLPLAARPGGLVWHAGLATPSLAISDLGNGKLYFLPEDAQRPENAVFRFDGANFTRFDSLALTPPDERLGSLLVLQDSKQLLLYQVQSQAVATLSGSGTVRMDLRGGVVAQNYFPQSLPMFTIGARNGEAFVYEASASLIFRLPWTDPWRPTIRLRPWGGQRPAPLSTRGPNPTFSLDLEGLVGLTMDPRELMTLVIRDPLRGDLILSSQLRGGDEFVVAGQTLTPSGALVMAGGGAVPDGEGRAATDVSLAGVSSAEVVQDQIWWTALSPEVDSTGLSLVDAEGLRRTVTTAQSPLSPEAGALVPLGELRVAGEAKILSLPCLAPDSLLLLGAGAWWFSGAGQALSWGEQPVPAGEALTLWPEAVASATCLPGDRLGLLSEDGTRWFVPGEEAVPTGGQITQVRKGAFGWLAVFVEPEGWSLRLASPDWDGRGAPVWRQLTGLTGNVEGSTLQELDLADDGGVWAGGPDGALYGALPGLLLRIPPGEEGLSTPGPVEVLWEGRWPGARCERDCRATAITVGPGSERVRLFVAAAQRVYRVTQTDQGPWALSWMAGGGESFPGIGADPRELALGEVEGLVVDMEGKLWMRAGGLVRRLRGGRAEILLGGGQTRALEARTPWELWLAPTVGAHPALAMDGQGRILTSDPVQGVVIQVSP